MSGNVNADLQALIDFRAHLIAFNHTLADEFSSMRSHYNNLGDVWRDAKYTEFGQALEDVSRGIECYLTVTGDQEGHLLRLIEALRAYLDTH